MVHNIENVRIDTRQMMTDKRRDMKYDEELRDHPQGSTSSRISFSRVFCCANSFLTTSKDDEMMDHVEISLCKHKENVNPRQETINKDREEIDLIYPQKHYNEQVSSGRIKTKNINEVHQEHELKQSQSIIYHYLSDDTESIVTSESDLSQQHQHKRDIQSLPRFRTERLKKLRKRMTLNGASAFENPDKLMKSAFSFDTHIDRKKERSTFIHPEHKNAKASNIKRGSGSSYSQLLKGCDCFTDTTLEKSIIEGPYKSLLETTEEMAYDSDPEFFHANISISETQDSNNSCCVKRDLRRSTNCEEHLCPCNSRLALDDELSAARLMRELTHGSINLIWHLPTQPLRSSPPTCVRMWIELGCRLQKQMVQPKLIWRSAYNEGRQEENGRHLLSEPECSGDIDLLDISRILILEQIDRQEFPLAILKKSFVIVTSDKKRLLFEVSSYAERQRIVSGLKLLVAKLAAMIIVGDRTIFQDFFHPIAFGEYYKQNECVNLLTST